MATAVRGASGLSGRTLEQSIGRASVAGGLLGVLVMGPAVFLMAMMAGAGGSGSLGIALFCAFWGGLGFGCMLGAVVGMTRAELAEGRDASVTQAPRGGTGAAP